MNAIEFSRLFGLTQSGELVINLRTAASLGGLTPGPQAEKTAALVLVLGAFSALAAAVDTPEAWSVSRSLAKYSASGDLLGAECVECAICHVRTLLGPGLVEPWRAFGDGGKLFHVCPLHFAPDGSSPAELMQAYGRVMQALDISWDPEVGF
jgi:hypothetical protein